MELLTFEYECTKQIFEMSWINDSYFIQSRQNVAGDYRYLPLGSPNHLHHLRPITLSLPSLPPSVIREGGVFISQKGNSTLYQNYAILPLDATKGGEWAENWMLQIAISHMEYFQMNWFGVNTPNVFAIFYCSPI